MPGKGEQQVLSLDRSRLLSVSERPGLVSHPWALLSEYVVLMTSWVATIRNGPSEIHEAVKWLSGLAWAGHCGSLRMVFRPGGAVLEDMDRIIPWSGRT